jgi:anti-sigma B factor antagonist
MVIETVDERGFYLVVLHGDVGYEHEAELRASLEPGLARPERDILLDFTDVRYIDSAGLNVVLAARRRAGRMLSVIGLNPTLRRLFNIAGLTTCDGFRLFANVEEAVSALLQERVGALAGPRTSQLPCLAPAPSRCMLPGCTAAAPVTSDALT